MSPNPVTPKQRQILDAVVFLSNQGQTPTVREVAALVGLRSPATVMKHLQTLERAGLLELSGKSRGIRLLKGAGIPIVGRIAAGEPIENPDLRGQEGSDEGIFGFPEVAVDPGLFFQGAAPGELVALEVVGESMVDAGILPGDLVIIRRQPTVEQGEIAAVTVDGEGTLKRWHRARRPGQHRPGRQPRTPSVRLSPANRRFAPIEIRERDRKEVLVFGKYVGLIRGEGIRLL